MQTVQDIMTDNVRMISASLPIARAGRIMKDQDIGFLVVTDNDSQKPVGCVTDRDIVINGVSRGFDPNQHPVAEVMNPHLFTCDKATTMSEAADEMKQHRVKRMLVTDENHNVIGVVSLGDIATRASVPPGEMTQTMEGIFRKAS